MVERPPKELTWNLQGELYDLVRDEVMALWMAILEKYADQKISFTEIFELLSELIGALLRIVDKLDVPNKEKRELLLAVIDDTYEQVIAPLDLPYVPALFEPFADKIIGKIVHETAELALAYLLPDVPSPPPAPELDA